MSVKVALIKLARSKHTTSYSMRFLNLRLDGEVFHYCRCFVRILPSFIIKLTIRTLPSFAEWKIHSVLRCYALNFCIKDLLTLLLGLSVRIYKNRAFDFIFLSGNNKKTSE